MVWQERLTGLIQLYDPTAGMFYVSSVSIFSCIFSVSLTMDLHFSTEDTNANVNLTESEQVVFCFSFFLHREEVGVI